MYPANPPPDEHLVRELAVGGLAHGAYLRPDPNALRNAPAATAAPTTARPVFSNLFMKPLRLAFRHPLLRFPARQSLAALAGEGGGPLDTSKVSSPSSAPTMSLSPGLSSPLRSILESLLSTLR